jgi:membrane-associated phospholipid phosphatase
MDIERYKEKYDKHAGFYHSHPALKTSLSFLDKGSVAVIFCLYFVALILAFIKNQSWAEYKLIVLPLSGFIIASLLRLFIDKKRPYEVGIHPLATKPTKGKSFPSRHLASAFLIGTTLLPVFPVFGGIVLFLGVCLGYTRCALGLHFPSDVIAGALLGVFVGGISFI